MPFFHVPFLFFYREKPDPVVGAPWMLRGDAVVTLHPGLREVYLPNITKHHAGLLLHGDDAAAVEG